MQLLGIAIEALPEAGAYFIGSSAFALFYRSRPDGIFHLAQGGVMISSLATFNYVANHTNTIFPGILIGVILGAALSSLIEFGVYRCLRRNMQSADVFLLTSLGVMLVLERIVSMWRGTMPLHLYFHGEVAERYQILGAALTSCETLTILTAAILCVALAILYSGAWGQRYIAVRQSELSYNWRVGESSHILHSVAAISGALAALGAILIHLEHRVVINGASMRYLLPYFVVVLMAGSINDQMYCAMVRWAGHTRVVRVSFVCLMLAISCGLAWADRIAVIFGDPKWKDSFILAAAIISLVAFSIRRLRYRGGGQNQ